jgi:hypothetical protein
MVGAVKSGAEGLRYELCRKAAQSCSASAHSMPIVYLVSAALRYDFACEHSDESYPT